MGAASAKAAQMEAAAVLGALVFGIHPPRMVVVAWRPLYRARRPPPGRADGVGGTFGMDHCIVHVLSQVPPAPPSPGTHLPRHSTSDLQAAPSASGAAHLPPVQRRPAAHSAEHASPATGRGAAVHLPPSQRSLPHCASDLHAPPSGSGGWQRAPLQ